MTKLFLTLLKIWDYNKVLLLCFAVVLSNKIFLSSCEKKANTANKIDIIVNQSVNCMLYLLIYW